MTIEECCLFGDYDAPHGHGQVSFDNVRVLVSNFIAALDKVLKLLKGRLGPGRIHHCMRCIGALKKALELMIDRGMSCKAFGKELLKLGGNLERVAEARVQIDQALFINAVCGLTRWTL